MKQKKIPLRKCTGCNEMKPKKELVRVVRLPDTVDEMLAIHDVKVVQGDDRLFVAMPSRRDELGIFRDIVHPISAEARGYLESAVIEAYEERMKLDGESLLQENRGL